MSDQPLYFTQRVQKIYPLLFLIWLVLTVFSPHQDLYKAFFYLLILPAGLLLVFSGRQKLNWKDPFLIISLIFFVYAGITTLIIGLGPIEHQYRGLRWSMEISLGLILFFSWMPRVVEKPLWWGRVFLWVALLGAASAIFIFVFIEHLEGRLTGLGALHQWVQVAYVLLLYVAVGQFMLSRYTDTLSTGHKVLLMVTFFTVCLAVLLSQSRTSIATMVVYMVFLGIMYLISKPKMDAKVIVVPIVSIVATLIVLNQFYSFEEYLDRLIVRGMSARIDIWTGYWQFMPDSWFVGFGSGTQPEYHPAAEGYWRPNKLHYSHPHNLILGTLVDTGIVGLLFLMTLMFLVVRAIFKHPSTIEEKIRLLGILGLIFLLSMTGGQTIISSIKAIWLYFWIPVVFIWFWCRYQSDTGPTK